MRGHWLDLIERKIIKFDFRIPQNCKLMTHFQTRLTVVVFEVRMADAGSFYYPNRPKNHKVLLLNSPKAEILMTPFKTRVTVVV